MAFLTLLDKFKKLLREGFGSKLCQRSQKVSLIVILRLEKAKRQVTLRYIIMPYLQI